MRTTLLITTLIALCAAARPLHALTGQAPQAASPTTVKLPDGPGSVQGLASEASVSLFSGDLGYQLPLELPAAGAGFAPRLALVYAGELGHGPVGVGWSLTSVSIRRSLRDGVPDYDADDPLELDGLGGGDLVPVGPGEWRVLGAGQGYRIRADGDGFVIVDADGLRYELGLTPGARLADGARTAEWFLERVVDVAGQSIELTYTRDRGQLYLTEVVWGPQRVFRAIFEHEARPDKVVSWRTGFLVETAQRLARVRVESFAEEARHYELAYDDSGSLSRLARVRLIGRGGADMLPPLSFTYASTVPPSAVKVPDTSGWVLNQRGTSFLDVDGDGLIDLVRMEAGAHRWRRNLGGSFAPAAAMGGFIALGLASVRLADLDGDSHAELVHTVSDTWRPYRLEAGKWLAEDAVPGSKGVPLGGAGVVLIDVDGDRRTDVLRAGTSGNLLYLNGPGGLAAPVAVPAIAPGNPAIVPGAANVRFFDVNGDGLDDAIWLTQSWLQVHLGRGDGSFVLAHQLPYPWSDAARLADVELADLNRDGLMDLVRFTAGHVRWYRGLADGSVVAQPVEIARPEGADADVVVAIVDASGNGSQDVVWSSPRGLWLLDLAGATSAGMLVAIDNGMGKRQTFEYRASTQLAVEDDLAGRPWQRRLPIAIPVPVHVVVKVAAHLPERAARYRVRDGFWDALEHRFGGFLESETFVAGGSPADDYHEVTRFHAGEGDERVLRGELAWSRIEDGAGRVLKRVVVEHEALALAGMPADPRLRVAAQVREQVEHDGGVAGPVVVVTEWDHNADGLPFRERQLGRVDLAGDERSVEQVYATDAATGVFGRVCGEIVRDADGAIVAHTRTYYGDHATEASLGQAGRGFIRRREGWLAEAGSGADGRWVTLASWQLSPTGQVVRKQENGVEQEITYDATGLFPIAETVRPAPGRTLTWSATYDAVLGVPVTHTDPNGVTTRLGRDGLGRLTAMALGDAPPHVRYAYDWARELPRTTTWHWDGAGVPPAEIDAWSTTTPWRQIVEVSTGASEPLYTATRLGPSRWIVADWRELDDQGRVAFVADAFHHDGDEPPASRPPGAVGQTIRWDALDRAREERLAGGAVRRLRYQGLRQVEETDGLGWVSGEEDGLGRVIRAERDVDGALEVVEASYDAESRIRELRLPGGVVQRYTYDTLGRLTAAHDPDIGGRTMTYDDAGRLVHVANGAGQGVSYSYDGLGRVVRRDTDGSGSISYHYDVAEAGVNTGYTAGRLAWVAEPDGHAAISYDALGRPIRHRRRVGAATVDEQRELSASGLLLSSSADDGFAITLTYDAAGRPVRVGDLWEAMRLDADGTVLESRRGSAVVEQVKRDVDGQVTRARVLRAGQALYDVALARNPFGSLTQVDDLDGTGLDHTAWYAYDGAGRLVDATFGQAPAAYQFTYRYDGLQNLVERTASGPRPLGLLAGTYHHGERGQGPRQLTRVSGPGGDVMFDHDAAGRQVAGAGRRMTYDALDQLVRVELPGGGVVTHEYGYDAQRVRTVAPDGAAEIWLSPELRVTAGAREHYVRLGEQVIAKVALPLSASAAAPIDSRAAAAALALALALAAALLTARALRRAAGAGVAVRTRIALAGTTLLTFVLGACVGAGDQTRLGARRDALAGATIVHLHHGAQSGPVLLTAADGRVIEERRHEPFGAPLDAARERPDGTREVVEVDYAAEPLNGLAKPTDPATGWSYHGARWLAPETARWLTPDPPAKAPDSDFMTRPWDLHPYAYVRQNPVAYYDPDGENPAIVGRVLAKATERLARWGVARGAGHVLRRHVYKNLAQWAAKTKFGMNPSRVRGYLERVLKSPSRVTDQGRRLLVEKEFDHVVGRGGEKVIRVVVQKSTGKIITAFASNSFKGAAAVAAFTIVGTHADKARADMATWRAAHPPKPDPQHELLDFIFPIGVGKVNENEDELLQESRTLAAARAAAVAEYERSQGVTLSATEKQELGALVNDLYDEADFSADAPDDP